ncbi:hypothetical protein BY996DRAFT_6558707 [Phakopsora pachyrhizi]|nr:hypothetical protein BY996DRAFT_6558707 [Phakopsora pachyrhizi]
MLNQHSQHHLTGISPHEVDESKEAQILRRQNQSPNPEVPKATRPTEEPKTPGLDERQGEGVRLLDFKQQLAADANTFTYYYDLD